MKTIYTSQNSEVNLQVLDYTFQDILTPILDDLNGDFNQEIINQIVLWKVNRFASVDSLTLNKLNKLDKDDTEIDIDFTKDILKDLLNTKGIRLPMASTILRYKSPHIYQIIDQRVYRFITGEEIKEPNSIDRKIDYYLSYLKNLKSVCDEFNIDFSQSDRILYIRDKKENSDKKLSNY